MNTSGLQAAVVLPTLADLSLLPLLCAFGAEEASDSIGGGGQKKNSNTYLSTVSGEVQIGTRVTHTNTSAVAYFYPSAASGFFLKGGLGWSRLSIEVLGISVAENGGGAVFGLGYDALVGDNWSITPVLNFNGGAFNGGNTNISEIGVGVSWH